MRVKSVALLLGPVGFLGIPDASQRDASSRKLSKFLNKRELSPKDADLQFWAHNFFPLHSTVFYIKEKFIIIIAQKLPPPVYCWKENCSGLKGFTLSGKKIIADHE